MLVTERDPVVGDQRRKQKSVGSAACFTPDTADPDVYDTVRSVDTPVIVSVDGEAAGLTTGTFELVELEVIDDRIVIILRKVIAIFYGNDYHSLVVWTQPETVVTCGKDSDRGRIWLSFFIGIVIMIPQKAPYRIICRRMHQIILHGALI